LGHLPFADIADMRNIGLYLIIILFLLLGIVFCLAIIFSDPRLWNLMIDEQYRDSIHVALSLGRLDSITTLLAIVTIILSVFAAIGFNYIKVRSEQIASEASKETVEEVTALAKEEARKIVLEEIKFISEEIRANYRDLLRTIGEFHGIDALIEGVTGKPFEIGNKEITDDKFRSDPVNIKALNSDTNS